MAALLLVGAILAVFHETVGRMVAVWGSSGTYGHCYAVLPIAAWMVWSVRDSVPWGEARPFLPAVVAVAGLGFAWLLGELASVSSVQQFALVLMIQAAIVGVLGLRIAWFLAYPIAFLLFAVPTGDFLTPYMIDRTADFTVAAVRLTGVPIYREGNDFLIPSGRWSVVEACSGVRYLFASVMAGTAYAFLQYQSSLKRALFIVVSAIVPIVANWVRAYLIVMTGHLTSNEYATGADHLIYGAIFFGIIIFILFALGNRFRDPAPPKAASTLATGATGSPGRSTGVALALLIAAVIWLPASALVQARLSSENIRLVAPEAPAGWREVTERAAWEPTLFGARASIRRSYERDGEIVHVLVGYFADQSADAEMITHAHEFVRGSDAWRALNRRQVAVSTGSERLSVSAADLQSEGARVSLRTWYWLDGWQTPSAFVAKGMTAANVLVRGRDDAAVIVIWAAAARDRTDTPRLDAFLVTGVPAIRASLERARMDRP
jgi:exosortase A